MQVEILTVAGLIKGKINEDYKPEKVIFEDPIYLTNWYVGGSKDKANFNQTTIIIPKQSVITMQITKG